MDVNSARAHLAARYPDLANASSAQMVHAIASSDLQAAWRESAIRYDPDGAELPPVTAADAEAALVLLVLVRRMLDQDEQRLIDIARDRQVTWPRIAQALDLHHPQGAQQRRKRLTAPDPLLDPSRRTSDHDAGGTTLAQARRDLEAGSDELRDIVERHRHLGMPCSRVLIARDADVEGGSVERDADVVQAADLAEWLEGLVDDSLVDASPGDARELARRIIAGENTWDAGPAGEMALHVTVLWRDVTGSERGVAEDALGVMIVPEA